MHTTRFDKMQERHNAQSSWLTENGLSFEKFKKNLEKVETYVKTLCNGCDVICFC